MKNLVSIGCSFSKGYGLLDPENNNFGKLVSNDLNLNHINLSQNGASNLFIAKQGEYALESIQDIECIIIGLTSFPRVNVLRDNIEIENDFFCVEPVEYTDFFTNTVTVKNPIWIEGNEKFFSKERFKVLESYFKEIFSLNIQASFDYYSLGFIAHEAIKRGIKTVVIGNTDWFEKFFPENHLKLNFFKMSLKYPDSFGFDHLSEEGHIVLAEKCLTVIKNLS